MKLAFKEKWIDGYDWVIRVNPDVLIRNSVWLMDVMKALPSNNTDDKQYKLDGVFHWCTDDRIHTDFFAFRPDALIPTISASDPAFSKMIDRNHDATAEHAFQSILDSKRYVQVLGADESKGHCRVRGLEASVLHAHSSCHANKDQTAHHNQDHGYGDLVCNDLKNWQDMHGEG